MANYTVNGNDLTNIADAIIAKAGLSGQLEFPTDFVNGIDGINIGTDVSDTTATAGDVLSGKYFYTSAGTKTQGSIASQAAQTITPTTTDQTIASGKYLTGAQTIKGDANLVAANIAEGVTIFGVQGTHSGGGVLLNDVNFRDYDGTIVASYSAADFANLTSLPDNPDRTSEGLTEQGWNWTLANAKTYVATYGKLDIGQMYITTDGKTHVHIHLEQGRTSPMLGVCPKGTVDVDWGDGTTHDTLTGTNTYTKKWTSNHAYAAPGDYVIKLTVSNGGSMVFDGALLQYTSNDDNRKYVYQNAIQKLLIGSGVPTIEFRYCYSLSSIAIPNGVTYIPRQAFRYCYNLSSIVIPSNITSILGGVFQDCNSLSSIMLPNSVTSIGSDAFYNCYSLSSIVIPSSVTSIDTSTFRNCYSLSSIVIPSSVTSIGHYSFYNCNSLTSVAMLSGVTSIGNYAFQYCNSLSSIVIPNSITSIGGYAFYNCYSLSSIVIPSSVTSIDACTFYNCYGLSEIHFKRETPPTVSNSSSFTGIPTDCKIYVPTGKLSAYTGATNYPSSSTYTYIEE